MHTFITVPEAADLLGVTVHAIRDAVQRGASIGGKLGGRYIVSQQLAEAYRPGRSLSVFLTLFHVVKQTSLLPHAL